MKQHSGTESTPAPQMPPLPKAEPLDVATLDLLAAWRAEDATDDPLEILAAEQDLEQFKRDMNENRRISGQPLLYP